MGALLVFVAFDTAGPQRPAVSAVRERAGVGVAATLRTGSWRRFYAQKPMTGASYEESLKINLM
jgi:hypothetical protein